MVRSAAVAVAYDNSIFVIGGYDGERATDTVERFDTMTGKWFYDCASLPMPVSDAAAVLVDHSICLIGGATNCGTDNEEVLSTVIRYSPKRNQWTISQPMTTRRLFPSAVTFRGKVYVMGGVSPTHPDTDQLGGLIHSVMWVDTVEVYDSATDQWTIGTPLLSARQNPTAAIMMGHAYVLGGYCVEPLCSMEKLCLIGEDQHWTRSTDMPQKRDACRAIVLM
jgi:N-acetylneuraminic acid mutarotase